MGRELDGETAGFPYVKMAKMKLTGRKHTRRAPALPQEEDKSNNESRKKE